MEIAFSGEAMVQTDLLEPRYPNLSFLLRFQEIEPFLNREESVKIENLEKLDSVYIYGLGQGDSYRLLKAWLAENKERDLIFLEENLGALAAFLETEYAAEILANPQVHIRFNLDKRRLNPFLKECAESFPLENIGVFALLNGLNPPPACRARGHVVPVLTGYSAGITPGASRLVKIEATLHW